MASSLEELIEEWEERSNIDWRKATEDQKDVARETFRCISDLRDTMLVMEAEEVRKVGYMGDINGPGTDPDVP